MRTVHVAVVGLGHRGVGNARFISGMPGVHVDAICDLYEDRIKAVGDFIETTQRDNFQFFAQMVSLR